MKCAKSFQFHSHLESLWISEHQKFMFCGGAKPLSEIRIPKIEENTKQHNPVPPPPPLTQIGILDYDG